MRVFFPVMKEWWRDGNRQLEEERGGKMKRGEEERGSFIPFFSFFNSAKLLYFIFKKTNCGPIACITVIWLDLSKLFG